MICLTHIVTFLCIHFKKMCGVFVWHSTRHSSWHVFQLDVFSLAVSNLLFTYFGMPSDMWSDSLSCILSFYMAFYLARFLAFFLHSTSFLPRLIFSDILSGFLFRDLGLSWYLTFFLALCFIGHIFWPFACHIFWHPVWHLSSVLSGMLRDTRLALYLSYSGIWSDMLSHDLSGILSDNVRASCLV